MMGLAVHRMGIGPAAGGGYPLDDYTADLWACRWLGRLLTSYTGALIRIRRVSDDAETDINATASGGLDTSAILTHCGAGQGRVVTMYDQSGNGRTLTQATKANQPIICDSGAMSGTVGSWYGMSFSGDFTSGLFLVESSSPAALTAIEIFGTVRTNADPPGTAAQTGHPFNYQDGASGQVSHYPFTDGKIYDKFGSSARKTTINPTASITTAHVYNALSAASDWRMFTTNEESFTTATNTVAIIAAPQVGRNSGTGGGYQFNGFAAGAVVYSAAQSSRATIRGLLL